MTSPSLRVVIRGVVVAVASVIVGAGASRHLAAQLKTREQASAQTLPLVRAFSANADVSMRIFVPAGHVRVRVWKRDSIVIRGTSGKNTTFFGGGSGAGVKFGVESRSMGADSLPDADWEVTVPVGAHVWVKMIDGALDVIGTSGEVELYTVRGVIDVRDVTGVTSIESIDAPVTVRRANGDVRIRGSKGAVVLDDVRGTLSVATVSGPVHLSRAHVDGRVETIGGTIQLSDVSLAGAALELQSHAGAIELTLDPLRAPVLELSSRAGPVLGPKVIGNAKFGQLSARSFKGRISLHLQASTR